MSYRHVVKTIVSLIVFLQLLAGCGGGDDDNASGSSADDDTAVSDDTQSDDDAAPVFQAGAARVDVSPPDGVSLKMGGYGTYFLSENLCRWSTGKHDPLYATAIALDDGKGLPIILVNYDLVGFITTDVVRVQAGIARELSIPPERVVVSASHTHSGPDTVGIWGVMIPPVTGRDEGYLDLAVEDGIQAGVQAFQSRAPARLAFATGIEAEMHYNSNTLDPKRMVDDAMTLMVARALDGEPIATLMSWGCHPMVMGPQSAEISADFLGPYYEFMDEEVGGVNMFVQGPLGASIHPQNPYDPFEYHGDHWGTWQDVENFGRVLADDAQDLIDKAVPTDDTALSLVSAPVYSEVGNLFFVMVARLGLIPRDVPGLGQLGESTITAFSVGPARFATVPGELVPDIGLELRTIMGGEHQFVVNLGMDWTGYIITEKQYHSIAYIYNAILSGGPKVGTALLDAYREIYTP